MTYIVFPGTSIEIRESIALFAVEMEKEMQKKDKVYNDGHRWYL